MVQIIVDLEENENKKVEDFQVKYKELHNIQLNKARVIRKFLSNISEDEFNKILNK